MLEEIFDPYILITLGKLLAILLFLIYLLIYARRFIFLLGIGFLCWDLLIGIRQFSAVFLRDFGFNPAEIQGLVQAILYHQGDGILLAILLGAITGIYFVFSARHRRALIGTISGTLAFCGTFLFVYVAKWFAPTVMCFASELARSPFGWNSEHARLFRFLADEITEGESIGGIADLLNDGFLSNVFSVPLTFGGPVIISLAVLLSSFAWLRSNRRFFEKRYQTLAPSKATLRFLGTLPRTVAERIRRVKLGETLHTSPFTYSVLNGFKFSNVLIVPTGISNLMQEATDGPLHGPFKPIAREIRKRNLLTLILLHELAHFDSSDTHITSLAIPLTQAFKTLLASIFITIGFIVILGLMAGGFFRNGNIFSLLYSQLDTQFFVFLALRDFNMNIFSLFIAGGLYVTGYIALAFFNRQREHAADSQALQQLMAIEVVGPSEIEILLEDFRSYLGKANFWSQQKSTGLLSVIIARLQSRLARKNESRLLAWMQMGISKVRAFLSPHPSADQRINYLKEQMHDHNSGGKMRFKNWWMKRSAFWSAIFLALTIRVLAIGAVGLISSKVSSASPTNFIGGFAVSLIGGGIFLFFLQDWLIWQVVMNEPFMPPRSTPWKDLTWWQKTKLKARLLTWHVGLLESILYTASIFYGAWEIVVVWLGLKVAVTWHRWGEDPYRMQFNVFLIGTLISLFFSILGAWIAGDFNLHGRI